MGLIRDADPARLSPYLAQHQDNPVDWHEWGQDALRQAADEDKPILLSVGYAACHWCHVMAHESFADGPTAELMNRWFVNIKVDREERPDVDRIYMDAVQAMTGSGGWPMTVFLTPTGAPIYAGTYFPKERRGNFPGFAEVLTAVATAWQSRRAEVDDQAQRLAASLDRILPAGELPGSASATEAVAAIERSYDPVHGGFGNAPKFPQAPVLELLARWAVLGPDGTAARRMLHETLRAMARGGIYDRLGGGFARYSTDERWLVPHFEKMLYDNALLGRLYLRGWQVTGDDELRSTAAATLDYMMRDLALPRGGLASSEDADSDGEEGTFYVFSWEEMAAASGDDLAVAADVLGATPAGNFEGANVLSAAMSPEAAAEKHGLEPAAVSALVGRVTGELRKLREQRNRPGLDDKVVAAWNGLAVRAFAEAGAVLSEEVYTAQAERTARFLLEEMVVEGRLMRSWRNGFRSGPGFSDDYAAVAIGLLTLYQATGEEEWAAAGIDLAENMVDLFWDADGGGFYDVGHDAADLIHRPKTIQDNPAPAGNSLGAELAGLLGALTGNERWFQMRDDALRAAAVIGRRFPLAAGHMLAVAAIGEHQKEVAVVGDDEPRRQLVDVVWEAFRPECVLAWGPGDSSLIPLLAARPAGAGGAAAYVCRNFVCDAPVGDSTSLRRRLES